MNRLVLYETSPETFAFDQVYATLNVEHISARGLRMTM